MKKRLISLVLVLCLCLSGSIVAQGADLTWDQESPMPSGRRNHDAVTHDGKIYVFSGYVQSNSNPQSKDTYLYDTQSQSWNTLAPCPEPKFDYGTAKVGSNVYLFGGEYFKSSSNGYTRTPTDSLNIYNLENNSWTEGEALPFTMGYYDNATQAAAVGTDVYVHVQNNNELRSYDTTTNTWSADLVTIPQAGSNLNLLQAVEDKIYLNFDNDKSLKIYDTTNKTWSEGTSLPQSRLTSSSSVVIDNMIYMVGGRLNNVLHGDIYEYDTVKNVWRTIPSTDKRAFEALAYCNDRLYVIGGMNTDSFYETAATNSISIMPTGITLNEAEKSISVGAGFTLTAQFTPSDVLFRQVTFTSNDVTVATVSNSGYVIGRKEGTAVITAATLNGHTAECIVKVTKAQDVKVESVSVNPANAKVQIGNTLTLKAVIVPANATNKNVTWMSTNTAVATVSSLGQVKGISKGHASILVSTVDGGHIGYCNVQVSDEAEPVPVEGIAFNEVGADLTVGDKVTLTYEIFPDNAANKAVTWASSDAKVASVTDQGLVTALAEGETQITVTTKDGGYSDSCLVTVQKGSTPEINIAPQATVKSNTTSEGVANINDEDLSTKWSAKKDVTGNVTTRFDFYETKLISKAVIYENNAVTQYLLQYLDGATWRTIDSGTTIGNGKVIKFDPVSTNNIRIIFSSYNAPPEIFEVELYE